MHNGMTRRLIGTMLGVVAWLAVGAAISTGWAAAAATETEMTPNGLATDPAGNVYVSDSANAVVRKISPSGETSTVVAGIVGSPGPVVPGPATSSKLSLPGALAVDGDGNLYIADSGDNQVVVKVTPGGTLSIVAGVQGQFGKTITPGPATAAALFGPSGLAVDASGNLFITLLWQAVVAKVDTSGSLSVVAGVPSVFSTPTFGGPATESALHMPMGVARDTAGTTYIADTGNRLVERVDASGEISRLAGRPETAGDPFDAPAQWVPLRAPAGLALDSTGHLFIADAVANKVVKVNLISRDLKVVAGNGNKGAPTPGAATASALDGPSGVAVDPAGNVYIGDTYNHRILKVTPEGALSFFAGTGSGPDPLRLEPDDVSCSDGAELTGSFKDVTVPEGESCTLDGARVTGSVNAKVGSVVVVRDTKIGRDLLTKDTEGVTVIDSEIGRNAIIDGNDGPLTFQGTEVGRDLIFKNGKAIPKTALVLGNEVGRDLQCPDPADLAEECNAGGTDRTGQDPDPVPPPAPVEQSTTQEAAGQVASELSIELAPTVSLGALVPSLTGSTVAANTAVTVTSTAADTALQITDPDTATTKGFLVNTATGPGGTPVAYPLGQPLRVAGPGQPFSTLTGGPATLVSGQLTPATTTNAYKQTHTVRFEQQLGANEGLRSGRYGKTLTFSVSTSTP